MTRQQRLRAVAIGLGLFGLAVLAWHYWPLLRQLPLWHFDRGAFIRQFRHQGWLAVVPLALLLMAVTLVPGAPNSVVAILSGVCLGAPLGFVVNVLGLSVGNALGALLIDHVEAKHTSQKQSRLLDDLLKMRHPRLGVLLGYAVPFIPNTLVHVAAGKLPIPRRALVGLVALGSLPSAFFYAFGGDAALRVKPGRLLVAAGLLLASAAVVTVIRKDRKTAGE